MPEPEDCPLCPIHALVLKALQGEAPDYYSWEKLGYEEATDCVVAAIKASDYVVVRKDDLQDLLTMATCHLEENYWAEGDRLVDHLKGALGDG